MYIYINNDHGVDVSIIIIIQLKHIENNDILNHSHEKHLLWNLHYFIQQKNIHIK
jgi:hypothetical protein